MKLFVDPVELKKLYGSSPGWLRKLMNAYADGLNFTPEESRGEAARHPALRTVGTSGNSSERRSAPGL
jgi:hypothetical protein